jgi:hypothetical protein
MAAGVSLVVESSGIEFYRNRPDFVSCFSMAKARKPAVADFFASAVQVRVMQLTMIWICRQSMQ